MTWLIAGLLGGVAFSAQAFARASSFDTKSGEELYRLGCAACHGPDGMGMPRSTVGFDTPLPDFTDCTFATPEPDSDCFHSLESGSIFTAGAELGSPTGKETSGLGKEVIVFEPFLALGQLLPSDGFFQLQTGMELAQNSSVVLARSTARVP
jgi:hypothetical protein